MHLRIAFTVLFVMACSSLTAQLAKSPAARPTAEATIHTDDRTEWMEGTDRIVGLTKDQFAKAGLARLTSEEYKQLLLAMYENGETAAKVAVASHMTYECGPIPANY